MGPRSTTRYFNDGCGNTFHLGIAPSGNVREGARRCVSGQADLRSKAHRHFTFGEIVDDGQVKLYRKSRGKGGKHTPAHPINGSAIDKKARSRVVERKPHNR